MNALTNALMEILVAELGAEKTKQIALKLAQKTEGDPAGEIFSEFLKRSVENYEKTIAKLKNLDRKEGRVENDASVSSSSLRGRRRR
jgi:hypothetical protein